MSLKDKKAEDWLDGNNLSYDIWNKKYRYNNESFDEWLERVSGGNNEIKQLIINKKFLFGGRILANRGLDKKGVKTTLSNCYVITPPDDSIESIFQAGANMARTFSYGGGVGVDITKLRPKGGLVNNAAKTTSGAVSFMDFYSHITGLVCQEGRRGALMISISCTHPDIIDFINLKTDLEICTKANISIRMSDEFFECVERDDDFYLYWRSDGKELSQTVLSELCSNITNEYNTLYLVEDVDALFYVKKIKAKEILHLLALRNWEMGEPGILYWDRISNYNVLSNTDFKYAGVNPCVIGSTLILTKEYGYKEIGTLAGTKVTVWNGNQWSEVEIKHTGTNQHVNKITFSNGSTITCTDYHKFLLKDGRRIPVTELKVGDTLPKYNMPVIEHNGDDIDNEKFYYTQGFFSGDGYLKRTNEPLILLYGKKKELVPYFVDSIIREDKKDNRICLTIQEKRESYNKEFVPDCRHTIKNRLSWLAGLIDSDGTRNSSDGSCNITSVNRKFLENVGRLLNTLGVQCTIKCYRKGGNRILPTHNENNDYKEYVVQDSYRLLINATNVSRLKCLGLLTHRVDLTCNPNRDDSRFIKVESIEDAGIADNVYCMNEPYNHTFIANGILTGNCAEEPLPAGGSCLLSSLNLSKFVQNSFTDEAFVDEEDLIKSVKISVRALNEVLIEGLPLHPLQEQRESVADWRQIGLGIMGLGDMLIRLQKTYGSQESIVIVDKVLKCVARTAVLESLAMAKEFGCYPKCEKEKLIHSTFISNLDFSDDIKEEITKFGLYNSQLLTIAPTGTLASLLQISSGAEPNFAFKYVRKTISLNNKDTFYEVNVPLVEEYYGKYGNDITLPDYFISAEDVPSMERLDMQSTLQKYIDASISSTLNIKESASVEDVYNIYLNAWKKGLKGCTIWRDNCKRSAILTKSIPNSNNIKLTDNNSEKRPKTLDAKYFPVKIQGENFAVIIGFMNNKPYELFTIRPNKVYNAHDGVIIRQKKCHYIFKSDVVEFDDIIENNITNEEKTITLLVSQLLRHNVAIKHITKTLKKPMTDITHFVSVITRILSQFQEDEVLTDLCPECGEPLVREGGCIGCKNCGYSKCG